MRAERHIVILNRLKRDGIVRVDALIEELGVSANTVRRDLKDMAEHGLLQIAHGGAVAVGHPQLGLSVQDRHDTYSGQKQQMGKVAATLINDQHSIICDAGTTVVEIVKAIPMETSVTVITNAVNVAQQLLLRSRITPVVIGGILNHVTQSTTGTYAENFLTGFHADAAFISAGGVFEGVVYNTNILEVQIKQRMMDSATHSYLMCTSNKIGVPSVAAFASVDDFDAILTDDGIDEAVLEKLVHSGIDVRICREGTASHST